MRINDEIVTFLNKAGLPIEQNTQMKEAELPQSEAKKLQAGRQAVGGARKVTSGGKGSTPIRAEKKAGRNDPCPCGSGKKYKNCCGQDE